ncbi:enoyl-CoA hydratase-related protein [Acinetobacter baumannii]
MIKDLSLALTEYENNDALRCAIVFAHGDHFTAGLDLVELQPKLATGVFDFSENEINPWGTVGRKLSKPLIVAVQGYCYTAGIELFLNADIAIASENTQFAQMEVQRGILPLAEQLHVLLKPRVGPKPCVICSLVTLSMPKLLLT